MPPDGIRPIQNPHEQRDDEHDAEEAQLFSNDSEQKIGMRLGKVEELFDARAESHAEPFAAAERDQRMRQLITLVQRIGPWIEKARQALQTIRRGDHDRGERDG